MMAITTSNSINVKPRWDLTRRTGIMMEQLLKLKKEEETIAEVRDNLSRF